MTIEGGGHRPGRRASPAPMPVAGPGPASASLSASPGPRLGIDRVPFVTGGGEQAASPSSSASHPTLSSSAGRSAVSPYASPVLVLLAAVAILEGYRWLNVLPSVGWRPSAVVFTVIAVPLALAVTSGGRGEPGGPGGHPWAARAVTGAALLMVPMTVIALIHPRPPIAQLMGSTDLLFAVAALATVLINERATHGGQRRAGAPTAGAPRAGAPTAGAPAANAQTVGGPVGGQRRPEWRTIGPSDADGRRDRLT